MSDNINQASDLFEVAMGECERLKASLFSRRGHEGEDRPIFSPEVHEQKLAEIADLAERSYNGFRQAARESTAQASEALTLAEAAVTGSDPVRQLSADELALANARHNFAREDIEQWGMTRLIARIRTALAEGDKAEIFLLSRFFPARLQTERERGTISPSDRVLATALMRDIQDALADRAAIRKRDELQAKLDGIEALCRDAEARLANLTDREDSVTAGIRARFHI